jgi:hypothetical protein
MWQTFAWVGLAITLIGVISGLAVRAVRPSPFPPSAFGIGGTTVVAIGVLGITWSTVGALLVIRRPDNPIGRLMIVVGAVLGMAVASAAVAVAALAENTATGLVVASIAGALGATATPVLILVYYVPFIFPTGRAHTPTWTRIGRIWLGVGLTLSTLLLVQPGDIHLLQGIPNPIGFGPDLRPIFGSEVTTGLAALITALLAPVMLVALALRFRAAGPIERQQLKWFVFGTLVAVAGGSVVTVATALGSGPIGEAQSVAFGLSGTSIPIAIGIAILRYHLYDIDRIVSRSISYAVVSAVLFAVFGTLILVLQSAISGAVARPGAPIEPAVVAASTLLAAALFYPLRGRVQSAVDRRFHRARYDAERTVASFAGRLRDQLDLPTLTGELRRAALEVVEPTTSAVWIRASTDPAASDRLRP